MQNKLSTIIMAIVIILIICVVILFGIIIYTEGTNMPQNTNKTITTIAENEETDTSTKTENEDTINEEKDEMQHTEEVNQNEDETEQNEETNQTNQQTEKNDNNELNDPFAEIRQHNSTNINNEETTENNQETTQNNEGINYETRIENKYFYNQLNDYSKNIYQALGANKENMKTGNYKIELGNYFDSILAQTNGSDTLGNYYQSALEAYIYDNPEVFYLDPNKMYLNIETITRGNNVTYNVYIDTGEGTSYLINELSSKSQVDNAIGQIENVKEQILQNKTENTYDNIKMVHDYLIENIEYETTLSKPNIYNIYGALVNKECVCAGYARSFKYLMDELKIPCVTITGKGTNTENRTEQHDWNYVELNGKWYGIDCTWDDPVSQTGWVSKEAKTRYFLKGQDVMQEGHTPNPQFTEGGKVFEYPNLSAEGFENGS